MENIIQIKGIRLDIQKAIKRVKLDLRDDWFQDPLKYEDLLDFNFVCSKLAKYNTTNKDYEPSPALHIDIPKPGFTSRYSTETNIIDRVVYQAFVDYIADDLDSKHSSKIYSHRLNKDRSDEKYFFRYAVEEWRKFIHDTSLELSTDNNVLLLTDLSNFYENIGITDLKDVLDLYKPTGENEQGYKICIEQIKIMLSKWCERNTKRGLPQNRDASSFLANIFLHPVDDSMIKSGFNYFRYMDDIRIVCKNKFEARRALKQLISHLRKKGLNVNSKKTQILDYDNVEERKIIEQTFAPNDRKIDQIDALLKSRDSRSIQIAVPMLREKITNLIDNNNTLDREFRYCINRLERISRNEKLAERIDFQPINNRILAELVDQPWSTDTFSRYLGSVRLEAAEVQTIKNLLQDKNKNIYEWQCFYLWGLLTRYKYKDLELVVQARKNIESKENEPTIAACCLYLGAVGDVDDRKFVAEHFKYFNDHLIQRFALIAIKDLPYQPIIKSHVQDCIQECYGGSYQALNGKFSNIYQSPIEPLKEEEIYTDLPDDIS